MSWSMECGECQLIAVTNTTVVNTETMSELLRKIAALGLPDITLVLDNARYQHNAAVKALASQLGITLLFLPSYSPNLNLSLNACGSSPNVVPSTAATIRSSPTFKPPSKKSSTAFRPRTPSNWRR